MADADDKRRRASARSRTLAIAASVAAHIAFLAFLALGMRVRDDYGPGHVVEVQLVSPAPPPAPARRAPAIATRSGRSLRITAAPALPVAGPATQPSAPLAPSASAASSGLASALRRGLGCAHADFMDLSSAERRHCQDRMAAATVGHFETANLGIDPAKRAIFDAGARRDRFLQTPFLAEKPRKGCRPGLTEQDVGGNAPAPRDWTVSVACGVPF